MRNDLCNYLHKGGVHDDKTVQLFEKPCRNLSVGSYDYYPGFRNFQLKRTDSGKSIRTGLTGAQAGQQRQIGRHRLDLRKNERDLCFPRCGKKNGGTPQEQAEQRLL